MPEVAELRQPSKDRAIIMSTMLTLCYETLTNWTSAPNNDVVENLDARAQKQAFASDVSGAFGAKLRRLRRARDLSQEELALKVGISRPAIATVEAGRQNIQLHHVYQFARALDLPPAELLPSPAEVSDFRGLSPRARRERVLDLSDRVLENAKVLLRMQLERGSYGTTPDKTGN